jgi:hypothetical protein
MIEVRIPRIKVTYNLGARIEKLDPKRGIYLVEVDTRYFKGEARTTPKPRFGYFQGVSNGNFYFWVPEEEGGLRFGERLGEGIALYRARTDKEPVMALIDGRTESLPTFNVNSRKRLSGPALEHARGILQREGLTHGRLEAVFVND